MESFMNWWNSKLEIGDERVADWFMMDGIAPTLILTFAYFVVIWAGRKFMINRKPFDLKEIIIFYNIAIALLNLYIAVKLLVNVVRLNYSIFCQPVNTGDPDYELNVAEALWWFYFSKVIEFLDTVFFVLRKKDSQISFLHVYHHSTMFPAWWCVVKWAPGGCSFFGPMINSFIHVLMYTYYGLAALGPKYRKYLWWKRYITIIQMSQFAIVIGQSVVVWIQGCDFPHLGVVYNTFYLLSLLALFLHFYFTSYGSSAGRKVTKSSSQRLSSSNGVAAVNGFASANGHLSNDINANNDKLD